MSAVENGDLEAAPRYRHDDEGATLDEGRVKGE